MIKKLSLFFAKQIRERMQKELVFGSTPGMVAATAFPANLMRTVTTLAMPEEEAKALGGPAWKFFDGLHAESQWVREAFRKAQRVEGVISFELGKWIRLELFFYKKGEKNPIFRMEVPFEQDTGEMGSFGCSLSNSI